MPDAKPNTGWVGYAFLGITAAGWALNWPAIKLLLREWPPLFSRGVAGVCAALILAAIAAMRGDTLRIPRHAIMPLAFAAFTNVFAWMGFSTVAMQWLSISQGALLVYTMPIWATLFAWPILGTRPTARGIAALVLGLAGIAVLLGGHGDAYGFVPETDKIAGIALALAAAMLFALGGVMTRSPLPLAPIPSVAWQVGLGSLPMVLLGLGFEHPDVSRVTVVGWAVLIYMTLVPMGVCYLTWFATLRRLPPATAATGMLIVPVLGVIGGALLLGEPLGLREVAAMALTLGGVVLALRKSTTAGG